MYDQLGGGRSDQPDDPSLWTIPRFAREVETVREALGLGQIHLYGQSWGGFLALEYALAYPANVRTLLLSNTAASGAQVVHEMTGLRMAFGPEFLSMMLKHEVVGDYTSPEYEEAVLRLYAHHLRRSTPFDLERSLAEFQEVVLPLLTDIGPAYHGMWGPNEFVCTGAELGFEVRDRLGESPGADPDPLRLLRRGHDDLSPHARRRDSGQRVRHLRKLEPPARSSRRRPTSTST